jgi:hypothetical protein
MVHTRRTLTLPYKVAFYKQQSGFAAFRTNKRLSLDQWKDVWIREGLDSIPEAIYFYESPPGGSDGVWGYFSFSPIPGTPHPNWTPKRDDEGEQFGWTFVSEDFTVGISKYVLPSSALVLSDLYLADQG